MNKTRIVILAFICAWFAGCKQDNWLDWKLQNEIWMQQNLSNAGVQQTRSGLQYKVLYQGNTTDARPNSSSSVIVKYKGSLINGAVFEESEAAQFTVAAVVKGFAEGLKRMNAQGDYIIYIPWELGYGEEGHGTEGYSTFIPPYSTLIFEVHLSAILSN